MQVSQEVEKMMESVFLLARDAHFVWVTPELILYVARQNPVFAQAFENCGGNLKELDRNLKTYLEEYMEPGAGRGKFGRNTPELSQGAGKLMAVAWESAVNSGRMVVELTHVIHAMYSLDESYAVYYMQLQGVMQADLLQEMLLVKEEYEENGKRGRKKKKKRSGIWGSRKEGAADTGKKSAGDTDAWESGETGCYERYGQPEDFEEDSIREDCIDEDLTEGDSAGGDSIRGGSARGPAGEDSVRDGSKRQGSFLQRYTTCLNDVLDGCNPLIGREAELERTMQVLCRKEKNNPLHIGEPGVGKTAIMYGFAKLLNEDKVPEPLRGARIFSLDLSSLLAGTQYRGDFEKRLKKVMDAISREEKPILYIDEIHNMVGAGAVNGGSFDISNMLKPYLSSGEIRFVGATTFEEYKKHFEKSKSLVRRFQNIEIKEPDHKDAVRILEGLRESYENFHDVCYEEDVLEYAVAVSAKYMNERFLPDKAIDLIDEAGAYRRLHPLEGSPQTVSRALIDEIVSKTCQIPKQAVEQEETEALLTLEARLKAQIFGQDEAVTQVVNAVKFSRAGLLEEEKPLASLLFVGPTGVGKTEIAKCLAKELGIRLIRFDMSEYEEKHAVAKLIGAPAGYVGYEEGGLLTEEIRRHPHAVLLLDEIEKAHPDIYHILLQVMDYATLTDNQGRKADFRNVILIMTSNAGARRMGKPGIGFLGEEANSDALMEEVRRVFQPEFRNRLNKIVAFRRMDRAMAGRIAEKKLGELANMLLRKHVELTFDAPAQELLQKKGISAEYGAREMERVIQSEVKPLFVDEILAGPLRQGGACVLTAEDEKFRIIIQQS